MLATMIAMMSEWRNVFAQERTLSRAITQALALICLFGRRTIARMYLLTQQSDWSSAYKLHSRSQWEAQDLFTPALREALAHCPGRLLPLGTDDTRLSKSGKKIKGAYWGRDPLSPPFHLNLKYGMRYLHTAVLLPLQRYGVSARAIPVWFEEATPLKKPGKKATESERAAYREAQKQYNLSTQTVAMFQSLRQRVDELGGRAKTLVFALDGSFCNRTIFQAALERTTLIARARKDAALCFEAKSGRRIYRPDTFTPEAVRQDGTIAWLSARLFHGGQWRRLQYKEVKDVLWRKGSGAKPLRLLVLKPTPYYRNGKVNYRQPAYLLTTDLKTAAWRLLQIYLDRWQVEVAHKELKQDMGLGQAQLRVAASLKHQPALTVATYSLLHLAALKQFGARRTKDYGALPKYQREKARASCQDLLKYVRREVTTQPELLPPESRFTADLLAKIA